MSHYEHRLAATISRSLCAINLSAQKARVATGLSRAAGAVAGLCWWFNCYCFTCSSFIFHMQTTLSLRWCDPSRVLHTVRAVTSECFRASTGRSQATFSASRKAATGTRIASARFGPSRTSPHSPIAYAPSMQGSMCLPSSLTMFKLCSNVILITLYCCEGLPGNGAAVAARELLRLCDHSRRPHRAARVSISEADRGESPALFSGGVQCMELERRRRRARVHWPVLHNHREYGRVERLRRFRARDRSVCR